MAGGRRPDHWRSVRAAFRLGLAILIASGLAAAIWFGLSLDPRTRSALIVFALAIVG